MVQCMALCTNEPSVIPLSYSDAQFLKHIKAYSKYAIQKNAVIGLNKHLLVSRSGSVGRAVASNSKGLRFESIHRQTFIVNCIEKTKIKKKRPGMARF